MAPQDSLAPITRRDIKRSLANGSTNEVAEGFERFLPESKLQSLIQESRVRSTLIEWISGNDDQTRLIDDLTNYVMTRGSRVFLTLLYIEASEQIKSLQAAKFKDVHLPIRITDENEASKLHPSGTSSGIPKSAVAAFKRWKDKQCEDFTRDQWIFLAPVFKRNRFRYEFHANHRLPFILSTKPITSDGYFGTIKKVKLHVDNQNLDDICKPRVNGHHIEVALKELAIKDPGVTDVEKFYVKEMAIAAYKKGTGRYFVFPWAEEGSLQSFWEAGLAAAQDRSISWAINQMKGICEGTEELHKKNTRHGDIKPANILCFKTHDGGSGQMTLVVADVGLAKVHEDYTNKRFIATTTKYGTLMYDPPETPSYQQGKPVSRLYDIWGLGCVFLEFSVWLLRDWKDLQEFRRNLKQNENDSSRFWQPNGKRNPAVDKWIKKLQPAHQPSLQALLGLISERMLVPEESRINARDLVTKLKGIQAKVSKRSNTSETDVALPTRKKPRKETRTKPRTKGPAGKSGPKVSDPSQYRTSKLDSRWRSMPDNDWASRLMSCLDWPSLRPMVDASRICQSCSNLDFGSLYLDLHRSVQDLESSSDDCSLCHFLYRCLSKPTCKPHGRVTLSRDDASHTFRLSSYGTAVISIYHEPGPHEYVPSYAQLGLPLLPISGSSQQFELLNGWTHLCDATHNCLPGRDNELTMPTRLVDVGKNANDFLRLVETDDNTRGRFVALSHCWGNPSKEKMFCTSADNIESLKKDIPHDVLPKTFQDAVKVTRALGITYLWIDSLCIIQGDNNDWELEAGRMEDVFSSAYCVIAASSATSSREGFLDKAQRAAITVKIPQGPLHLADAIDDFQAHVEKSVLNTRGWVFQERALARRTIHFTSRQVYWECGRGIYCETLAQLGKYVYSKQKHRQSQVLGDSDFPSYILPYYKDERIRLVQYIYQFYSGLQLTKPSDRSKAILGLQKRLSRIFDLKQGHGLEATYGIIWAFFERTLLWQAGTSGGMARIKYDKIYAVPSWSWMAYMGKIQYMKIQFSRVNWTGNLQRPFTSPDDSSQWDGRLVAHASKLFIDTVELSKRSIMDLGDYRFDPVRDRCVVVGTSKDKNSDGGINQCEHTPRWSYNPRTHQSTSDLK
ncbi:serine threonine kinase [Fusarium albosuccineum]|uniref:Serine threonine kinase n=1 Tax=Fusarium albosuccineum TaxID=1237068 RepID=A0A8H4LAF3_9HYPO|nr:serine threonine kinase [Fusarium albosuccineum]